MGRQPNTRRAPQTPRRWGEGCFPPPIPKELRGSRSDATRPHPQASRLPLPAGNARNSQRREDRSSWLDQRTGARGEPGRAPSSRDGHHAPSQLRNPSISQPGNCPPQQEREASQTAGEDEISPRAVSGAACNKTSCAMAVPVALAPGQCPTAGFCFPMCTRVGGWQGITLPFPTIACSGAEAVHTAPRMLAEPGHGRVIRGSSRSKPGIRDAFILGEPRQHGCTIAAPASTQQGHGDGHGHTSCPQHHS